MAARGLAATFDEGVEFAVQARCHDVRELPSALGVGCTIDAVVIDVDLCEGDALCAFEAVRRLADGVAVLLLAPRVDQSLLRAIAQDRVSCVSPYSESDEILSALRSLLRGQTQLPPDVQRALISTFREPPPSRSDRLTSREEQILELAATGLTIAQIATTLHISHSTAKTHLMRVYEKLEAPNRSAAIATAVARGLLQLSAAAA